MVREFKFNWLSLKYQHWNTGVMEYWSDDGNTDIHYSNTPVLHKRIIQ
jgi:hypothetical protein